MFEQEGYQQDTKVKGGEVMMEICDTAHNEKWHIVEAPTKHKGFGNIVESTPLS